MDCVTEAWQPQVDREVRESSQNIPVTNVLAVEIAGKQNLQELVDCNALKSHMKPQPLKTNRSIQGKGEMDRTVNSRHFKRPKPGDS